MMRQGIFRHGVTASLICTLLLFWAALLTSAHGAPDGEVLSLTDEMKADILKLSNERMDARLSYIGKLREESPSGRTPRSGDWSVDFPINPEDKALFLSAGREILAKTDRDWETLLSIVRALIGVPPDEQVVQFLSQILYQEVQGSPGKFERGTYTTAVSVLAGQGTDEALQFVYEVAILPVHQTPGLLAYSGSPDDGDAFRLHVGKNAWVSIIHNVHKDKILPLMQKVAKQYPLDGSELRKELDTVVQDAERIALGLPWRGIPDRESHSTPTESTGKDAVP